VEDLYIVTGGAGFIGSNFVRACLEKTDARVLVLDKLTYAGNLESLEDCESDPRFGFIHGDIADRKLVHRLVMEGQPSAILNFAAETHVDRSIDEPEAFVNTNVVGTFVLLDEARLYWQSMSEEERSRFRFLQVSTDEVYGSLGSDGAFSETTPVCPNSPYSASKASADHFVHAFNTTYGLPALITNCSNNYGPFQFPEKLIPLMILNALEGRPLPIYGDGGNVRDWLFVEDHCSGILEVLGKGRCGERYNLGGKCEKRNVEIVDLLCEILDDLRPASRNAALKKTGVQHYSELKTFVPDRPGHDRRYAMDTSRVESELGWQPSNTLESGLRKTVLWYLDNLDWCEAVQARGYRRERLGLSQSGGES
jgi:dTDP-glucose 4,6-dehydratase